jgi:hypothetical protein
MNKSVSGSRPGSCASSEGGLPAPTNRNGSIGSVQAKIDIEDYYNVLKEKLRGNCHETKTKFRNADPDGKGGVTKEALAHIIASLLGPSKPLSHQHYIKLLEKLGLKNRIIIK